MRARAAYENGSPYDTIGLLRFLFHGIKPSKYAWWCSEYVTALLQEEGLWIGLEDKIVSPNAMFCDCASAKASAYEGNTLIADDDSC